MASENSTRTPNGFLVFVGSAALLVVVGGVFIATIGWNGGGEETLEQKRAAKRTEVRARLEKEAQEKLNSTGWVDKAKGTIHIPINEAITQVVAELKAKKPTVSQVKVEAPLPMPVADPNSKDPAPPALPSAPQGADTIRFPYPTPEAAVATPAPATPAPAPATPAPVPVPATPVPTPATPAPKPATPVPGPGTPVPAPATPVPATATPVPAPVIPPPAPAAPVPVLPPVVMPVKPAESASATPVPAPATSAPVPVIPPPAPAAPVPAAPVKPAESAPPVPPKPAEVPAPAKPSDAPAADPTPAAAPTAPPAPSRPPIINPTENSELTK